MERILSSSQKPWAIALLALGLCAPGACLAAGQHKPAVKKSSPKQPAPTKPVVSAPVLLPDPPLPVAQAQQIELGQCVPVLDRMARATLTSTYDVQSGWSRERPAGHIFQSVAILTRPGNVPPDGLAALVAAPLAGGGCDGMTLQVFPLAGDCQAAQKLILAGGGQTLGPLLNARIMLDAERKRLFLLPGFNNTCMAIAVDSTFGDSGIDGRSR